MVAHISVAVFDQQKVAEFVIGISETGNASSGKNVSQCMSLAIWVWQKL